MCRQVKFFNTHQTLDTTLSVQACNTENFQITGWKGLWACVSAIQKQKGRVAEPGLGMVEAGLKWMPDDAWKNKITVTGRCALSLSRSLLL